MKHYLHRLFFFSIASVFFLIGCGTPTLTHQPTTLQVTRVNRFDDSPPHSWTITDAKSIQQLFQEIQNLPLHHNGGGDMCIKIDYEYSLNFLVGTKSIQKDRLYMYCGTLTLEDGSSHDPTATFNSLLMNMLSVKDLQRGPQ